MTRNPELRFWEGLLTAFVVMVFLVALTIAM